MLNRVKRHGRLGTNPVQGVEKFKEPEGRTLYLAPDDPAETAIMEALASSLRPLSVCSCHTGLRWSEQISLNGEMWTS
jgi:hypothetical protein